ncbi:MAG: preprotein translocase subunit SecG [Candidatus Sumerlaeia bacterium]
MTIFQMILVVFYLIACVILIAVILFQSGKGGGLSSLGAASQGISDAFGTTGGEHALNTITKWAAVGYIVIAIAITWVGSLSRQDGTILGNRPPAAQQQQPAAPATGAGQSAPVAPAPAQGK